MNMQATSIIILFGLIFPHLLYAYIDPGSGSYMIQLVIGALIGGLFAIKLFWKNKIGPFFKNLFHKRKKNEKIGD